MSRFIEFEGGDVESYLKTQENKDLLRFITCGSVDDGKSTLIGRLLYEAKMLFEDQLLALEADSRKMGTQGGNLDFALLVDGLEHHVLDDRQARRERQALAHAVGAQAQRARVGLDRSV
ncbi:MAG TPA: GTP-binding protein, partial [Aestuariivirga sp.]|nr:GTP-binding protein [Aestuariivirga sp.]